MTDDTVRRKDQVEVELGVPVREVNPALWVGSRPSCRLATTPPSIDTAVLAVKRDASDRLDE